MGCGISDTSRESDLAYELTYQVEKLDQIGLALEQLALETGLTYAFNSYVKTSKGPVSTNRLFELRSKDKKERLVVYLKTKHFIGVRTRSSMDMFVQIGSGELTESRAILIEKIKKIVADGGL